MIPAAMPAAQITPMMASAREAFFSMTQAMSRARARENPTAPSLGENPRKRASPTPP